MDEDGERMGDNVYMFTLCVKIPQARVHDVTGALSLKPKRTPVACIGSIVLIVSLGELRVVAYHLTVDKYAANSTPSYQSRTGYTTCIDRKGKS